MAELPMVASDFFWHTTRFLDAYHAMMQPLWEAWHLPPPAVNIILYLANNPAYNTAKDICRCRGLKPSIVSFHVERLVKAGFLERRAVPGDRRKTALVCTEKAAPLVAEGQRMQQRFAAELMMGLSEEELRQLRHCMAVFEANIERLRQQEKSEETE